MGRGFGKAVWRAIPALVAAAACLGASQGASAGGTVHGSPMAVRWTWNSARSSPAAFSQGSPAATVDRQAQFRKALDSARRLFHEGQYALSRRAADQAFSMARGDSMRAQVQGLYDQLQTVGQEELTGHCQAYRDKKYAQAIEGFNHVSACFGKLPCAIQARLLLRDANETLEVQESLHLEKARQIEQSLEAVLAQPAPAGGRAAAIRKLDVDRQAQAVKLLEQLADVYDDTPQGEQAAKDLQSLRGDEKFMSGISRFQENAKAAGLIKMADAYAGAARPDKANEIYRQIVDDCPRSDWADLAKEKLSARL